MPYLTKDLDNTWELSVLPASYNGCLNIPLETSSQLFLDTIQKSPIFLQFFLRFARVKNILHFFLQENLRNNYVWQLINNQVFLIPSNRLLQERFEITTEDFYYVFLLSFITHRIDEFLYNHPSLCYFFVGFFGTTAGILLHNRFIPHIENMYQKLRTICRSNQKLVE